MADREKRHDKAQMVAKEADDLSSGVTKAREVMQDELKARMFHGRDDLRPSNSRLIQMYMSKQMPSKDYLPASWNDHARTLYLQALRDTPSLCAHCNTLVAGSPPRAAKKAKVAPSGMGLFRGAELKPVAAESPAAITQTNSDDSFDPVLDEMRRWEGLGLKEYSKFTSGDGLLNEFAMMWALPAKNSRFTLFSSSRRPLICRTRRTLSGSFHALGCCRTQILTWHTSQSSSRWPSTRRLNSRR